MVLINLCASVITIPLLLYTGLPRIESWPWLAASVVIHVGYYIGLTEAYKRADMSQVYPIARGSAPLLTALVALLFFGEDVKPLGLAGIVVLGLGIFTMSLKSAADATHMDRTALAYAGFTAVTICAYTLSDGQGARVSGDALAYIAALFVADGLLFTAFAWWLRGTAGLKPMFSFWGPGLAGGAMSAGAYGIAIWAMTVAPIPLVAAVRETSVLFGAAIAVLILKEPLRTNRVIAAFMILTGLVMIRLQ
jgi:drug/metabolite transporter (DMT)-like permease